MNPVGQFLLFTGDSLFSGKPSFPDTLSESADLARYAAVVLQAT